jgi:tRNA (guanine-N7-)-methyltransferase
VRRAPRLSLEALAPYVQQVADPPTTLEWRSVFGNANPVEIEVGSGKGLFLITAAQAHPSINYLGIEIERKYQLYTATRVAKRELLNARVTNADARRFVRDCVPSGSVQGVHVYFPDPWWKKRHHKRRVFTREFAAQCERVLEPGGWLRVATDVGEYFQIITQLLTERPGLREQPWPEPATPTADLTYFTNFERKARLQGKPIHRAVYERRQDKRSG